jgi:hypothetical protein
MTPPRQAIAIVNALRSGVVPSEGLELFATGLEPLVSVVEQEGIRFLIIKGIALAALTTTPAARGAGDVDVLVNPDDIPHLHRLLLDRGFRPALALPDFLDPASWRVWRFLDREATYLGRGTQLDVHWRISSQRHLFPDFPTLYARHATVRVADTTVPTLSRPDSLAASCFHAFHDQFQPARNLVDVVATLQALDDTPLPRYPMALQRLMSGVVRLVAEVFPGVVDERVERLAAMLPDPPAIVAQRFVAALSSPRVTWEESQDRTALWAKARAEAAFDHPLEFPARFLGKRLFDFPRWKPENPTTGFADAFRRRCEAESARSRSAPGRLRREA